MFFIVFRFVLDIFMEEGRPEKKDLIYRIPLLVPEVILTVSLLLSMITLKNPFLKKKKISGATTER